MCRVFIVASEKPEGNNEMEVLLKIDCLMLTSKITYLDYVSFFFALELERRNCVCAIECNHKTFGLENTGKMLMNVIKFWAENINKGLFSL